MHVVDASTRHVLIFTAASVRGSGITRIASNNNSWKTVQRSNNGGRSSIELRHSCPQAVPAVSSRRGKSCTLWQGRLGRWRSRLAMHPRVHPVSLNEYDEGYTSTSVRNQVIPIIISNHLKHVI